MITAIIETVLLKMAKVKLNKTDMDHSIILQLLQLYARHDDSSMRPNQL